MQDRLRSLFMKSLRLTTCLGVMGLGLGAIGVKVVHAKGAKAALAIGEPLGDLDVPPGGGTILTVNGQKLHLAAARVDASVHQVLERLERSCMTHADGLADDLGSIDGLMTHESDRGVPGIGILKDEREGHGVVVCFAPGEHVGGEGLVKRIHHFIEHHDLSDIGGMRYVTAHAEKDGHTRVTATWTDEPVSLDSLFPANGDAAGSDPAAAPRPAGRRMLSARVEPSQYGAFIYATTEPSAEAALARYHADMTAQQFTAVDVGDRSPRGRAYKRGLTDVLVTSVDTARGATISVIESHYRVAAAQGGSQ